MQHWNQNNRKSGARSQSPSAFHRIEREEKGRRAEGLGLLLSLGHALVHLVQEGCVLCSRRVRFLTARVLECFIHAAELVDPVAVVSNQ